MVNAVEGWGKTSLGAFADSPAILMAEGETGYLTLLGAKRVPAVMTTKLDRWQSVLNVVQTVSEQPGDIKTLVLDALGGFEQLCHTHVCNRDYNGKWEGKESFMAYHRGYDASVKDWLGLLSRLDRLHETGVAIVMLSHSHVRPFKNPMGEDFDRYIADCHQKTWGVTHKWADVVLFGNFLTITETKGLKTKGIGQTTRVAYAERRDAFDAKNRYGMPESFDIPDDPAQIWTTITHQLNGAANNVG